jgi:hypothetical protein
MHGERKKGRGRNRVRASQKEGAKLNQAIVVRGFVPALVGEEDNKDENRH